jgi:hypothetical protein
MSGLFAAVLAFLSTAPVAFAMNVGPLSGEGDPSKPIRFATQAGWAAWQVSLVVTAAVLMIAVVAVLAIRTSRRSVAQPVLP